MVGLTCDYPKRLNGIIGREEPRWGRLKDVYRA
jgi:hypothetical protein